MTDPLVVDLYAGDLGGRPDLAKLAAAGPPWCGVILKATEGLHYDGGQWFRTFWPMAKDVGEGRKDWLRGAYHYLRFDQDPHEQADCYLETLDRAGGLADGDLWPIVDVERAGNPDSSAAQIVDSVSRFAESVSGHTGRDVTLYGGSLLADKHITDHMGCKRLWLARYTASLPQFVYQRIGWRVDELFAWQYSGGEGTYLADYPHMSPIGRCDISAMVNGLPSTT